MKKIIVCFVAFITTLTFAQENLNYQKPHENILELAEAPLAPAIRMDEKGENMIFLYRSNFKSIEELSEVEMRLGGLRINPKTNIGSRVRYYNNIKVRIGRKGEIQPVNGLPENGRFAYINWSPNQKKVAFTNTVKSGVELWVLDIETATAKKLVNSTLNAKMGSAFVWFQDNESLLVKLLPESRKSLIDTKSTVPSGPTISVSEAGVKAQNRTYQDLLKNKNDEFNFEQLVLADLIKVDLQGNQTSWMGSICIAVCPFLQMATIFFLPQ